MTKIQQQLTSKFPAIEFQLDLPLAEKTYFKMGGPAEVFLATADRSQIQQLVAFCYQSSIPLTILGGASNVVVSDQGIEGLVLHLDHNQVSDTGTTIDQKTLIQAEAGIKTALLVKQVIDLGYFGLEYFLGVPGTLGGAVYNNAHYLEDLISQHIHRVEILDETGTFIWLTKDECVFGYDSSRFQQTKEIIMTVEFALAKGDKEKSQALIKEATVYRAQTQPLGEPSSGCIFQNVPITPELKQQFPQFADKKFVSGGYLIDQAGLKGAHQGEIEVSQKHAAFFINKGNGTSQDVRQLVARVKDTVKAKFGVELQEEVFYVGKEA
jgi:UDP-N-acetylmuramate dehydrogenase